MIFEKDIRFLVTKKSVRGFTIILNKVTTKDNNLLGIKSSASTCETSENDNISGGELSLESFDVKMWTGMIRKLIPNSPSIIIFFKGLRQMGRFHPHMPPQ